MLLEINKINLPPGQRVLLTDVNWKEFEAILEDLGEHRGTRIAYDNGTLEIRKPLTEQETGKVLISNLVEILLEELDIEFCPLGSTTFKNQVMAQGIEPDNCFYIKHEAAVRGKDRLDLTVDPPPDLALEIDVTSCTHTTIYQGLGVPELWQFDKGTLKISLLQEDGTYQEGDRSQIFRNFPLTEVIPQYLNQAKTEGRNKTMKAFRAWVREVLRKL
ncbi:Uma2 family endonuclease [Laspinema olomoucense]|uniref:Uma2 family endonuclease n=1 Tax=Laspinema olomoucense TaxID=3231600 RepID=UPI0021BAA750|nr:Uma2 family endonuclease [Laspinema sp. D3c]MCT7993260.1 Uma2 family endonuclease [Laspinema sp. D3c]